MKNSLAQLIVALGYHLIVVACLGVLGLFVVDVGVANLIPRFPLISYWTATAIMLGLYIINFFIKIQINRITSMRNQKYMIDKIVKFYIENHKDTK